ncbi:MAG TPA: nuclear transport factor 2 family protein [Myxococcota bacterium]|nr:nuclear transport factor 2 family protein [Myxococcota bacterium]
MAMGARKKSTSRKPVAKQRAAGSKPVARKPGKKPLARARAARAPRPSPAEELAKRIVAGMDDEFNLDLGKFYTEDAVSEEPAGGTVTGLQSLRSKLAGWLAGLRAATWKARHVFVSGRTICIEWEADLTFKDGRQMNLREIAVHEVRGDKICAERFYYDPRALMPPAQAPRPEPKRAAPRPPPRVQAEPEDEDEGSSVDPMDL